MRYLKNLTLLFQDWFLVMGEYQNGCLSTFNDNEGSRPLSWSQYVNMPWVEPFQYHVWLFSLVVADFLYPFNKIPDLDLFKNIVT